MNAVETLGRFELRRRIGTGHTGIVYEARDRETGELVALKTLKTITADSLYRLKREFRLLQSLTHRNLCHVYELLEDDGQWFVTMELVRGSEFHSYVARRIDDAEEPTTYAPRFDDRRLRAGLAQLAAGLHALHETGLVHRDVKPGNVLVTNEGRVVLLDFGFVLEADAQLSQSSTLVGTPRYMAPEQAVSGEVGPAADWYSVGVMLYEALTGLPPHETGGHVLKMLMDKQRIVPKAPRQRVAGVPEDLDALCMELLRVDPEQRPDGRMVQQFLGVETRAQLLGPAPSTASMLDAFVGRDDELTALRTAYEEVRDGAPQIVILEGPAGVGKSALIKRFTDLVVHDGAVVLAGRCFELESVPFKAFDGVIDTFARHLKMLGDVRAASLLPRHADALLKLFPVLGAVPMFAEAPAAPTPARDPIELRNRAFGALRDSLYRLGQHNPLVIAIDDWHWADADSLALARELLRHRDAPTALLIVSIETPIADAARARLDVGVSGTRTLRLEPFDDAEATDLAQILLATLAPTATVDAREIARESGGIPLHVSELVRHVATRPASSREPIRLDHAVAARVSELDADSRKVIEALAITGEPLPLPVVRELVDLPPTEFQRIVATLRVANLVRWSSGRNVLELTHQYVHDAVMQLLTGKEIRQWQRVAARVIEASALVRDRPELLVRLLEQIEQPERAAALALTAAQQAIQSAAFERAAALNETALRLGTFDEARQREIWLAIGDALISAGRGRDAAGALLRAAEGAEPSVRMRCHREAAEQLLISGHIEEGLEGLRLLLGEVGFALPATNGQALRSVIARRALLRVRGLGWKERRAGQIAPEALVKLDVLKAASHGLSMVDNIRGADFNARWLLAALRTGERTRCALAMATEAIYTATGGGTKLRRARVLNERVGKIAEGSTDGRILGYHALGDAAIGYWGCELVHARERAHQALQHYLTATTAQFEVNNARMVVAWVLRAMGAWKELDELVVEWLADAERRGDRYLYTSLVRHSGVLWLARDDVRGVRTMMERAVWVPPQGTFHVQHWYELELVGETALYSDDAAANLPGLEPAIAALDRSLLLRVWSIKIGALWVHARLALAAGDPRRAEGLVRKLDKLADPRAAVAARLLRAALLRRDGRTDAAAALLRDAIDAASRAEIQILAAVARRRLGELLGGREGEALVDQADAWMRRQGIVAPARLTAMYAPA